jgi:Mg-chelatase subunit ChlD
LRLLILLGMLMSLGGWRQAPPVAATGASAPLTLAEPTNLACLPFPEDSMVSYNGGSGNGPYTNAVDQTTITWRDGSDEETHHRIYRKVDNGSWTLLTTVPSGTVFYTDTGLDQAKAYRYYVVAYDSIADDESAHSAARECTKPLFVDSDSGNFRVFYRIEGCPSINEVSGGGMLQTCVPAAEVAERMGDMLEGARVAYIANGFGDPIKPAAKPMPVDLFPCDGIGCARSGGTGYIGLKTESMIPAFDPVTEVGQSGVWVPSHELFHKVQGLFSGFDDPTGKWISEGTARALQDRMCVGTDQNNCISLDQMSIVTPNYVNDLNKYLADPNLSILDASYKAAGFWTYLMERFGTSTAEPERGLDFMLAMWQNTTANPGLDGISILDITLALSGTTTFREAWKDWTVTNYAKDLSGPSVPAKYKYIDMGQPGGNYAPVALSYDKSLSLLDQVVDTDESVRSWGTRYYQVSPDANVPIIDVEVTQDSDVKLYYTVLGIKNDDIAYEFNLEARDLAHTVINNGYDKVVLIVTGLEKQANYRYSFNGTLPTIKVLKPTTGNKALVGDPAAPDKFMVQVEVVAGNGTPLAGVDLANFSFRVGAVDVPAGNILTSAQVQGQNWFVVRAPAQASNIAYDLTVNYAATLSATETKAVQYTPRTDADSVLIVDRSASMLDSDKLTAAKNAAKLYVDSWRSGDKLGVVGFNDTATLALGLTNWTDSPGGGSRQQAITAIDGLTGVGGTAIGDALRKGWDDVDAKGVSTHDWALILLSDGLETAGTEPFADVIADLVATTDKRPVVHTVAIGPDADRLQMQQVANATGGTYQAVSAPDALAHSAVSADQFQLDLDGRYRTIANEVTGLQQSFTMQGPLNDGNDISDVVTIPVESGAAEMVLAWSYAGPFFNYNVQLRTPSDVVVPIHKCTTRHCTWRVPTPQGGVWKLYVNPLIPGRPAAESAPAAEVLPKYIVDVALRSQVTMDLYLTTPPSERVPGVAMPILVSLTDTGPIKNASVIARIEKPSGAISNLTLFDDGGHGDGAAKDGIYGNTLYQTGQSGSYIVKATATGSSPLSGAFTRHKMAAFFLDGEVDTDGDGLPDRWESRHPCVSASLPDANADPDSDGLTSLRELAAGTNPCDADTDDGGENDGSEVQRGADPHTPRDDGIRPPRVRAWADVGSVRVRFSSTRDYDHVRILRARTPDGPWVEVAASVPPSSEWIDRAVTNDGHYCYLVEAVSATVGGASRASDHPDPTCATPRLDPYAPQGGVAINDEARSTASRTVVLRLEASDHPGDEEFPSVGLPTNPQISGVTSMLIANEPTFAGATWEPYRSTRSWSLLPQDGRAAVFVKYRDGAGNESEVAIATIEVAGREIYLPLLRR